jgi:excisionase family DNA binding protein
MHTENLRMKTSCVSQLELVAAGFESNLSGVSVARPEGVDAPAIETTRRDDTESASPLNTNRKRRAPAGGEVSGLEALLTFSDAALSLGISLRHFRRLVDSGKIAFVKVSERTPRVRPRELQRFLDASMVKYSEVKS